MNKIDINIWNRDFSLTIALQEYPGIEVTSKQVETLDSVGTIDFMPALNAAKGYVRERNGKELSEPEITNIFRYIMPNHFYIPRRPDGLVILMCDYRFDPEHGLAVVFADGQFKKVCTEDEVL